MSATSAAVAIQKRIANVINNKFGNTVTMTFSDPTTGAVSTVTMKAILDEQAANVQRWFPKDVQDQPNRTEVLLLFPYTAAQYLMTAGSVADKPIFMGTRRLVVKRVVPQEIADTLLAIAVIADP